MKHAIVILGIGFALGFVAAKPFAKQPVKIVERVIVEEREPVAAPPTPVIVRAEDRPAPSCESVSYAPEVEWTPLERPGMDPETQQLVETLPDSFYEMDVGF